MSAKCIIPDEAEVNVLRAVVEGSGVLTYHLFKNQVGVQDSTTLGSFVESDYTGYAPVTIAVPENSLPVGVGGFSGNQATTGFQTLNFPTNTGSAQVTYGLYVTFDDDSAIPRLLYCSNCFDGHAGFTATPDGFTVATGSPPPPIFTDLTMWDFSQPTP